MHPQVTLLLMSEFPLGICERQKKDESENPVNANEFVPLIFICVSQVFFIKALGRIYSYLSSSLQSSAASWETGGGAASPAPAAAAWPRATSCWHQWPWRAMERATCTWVTLTSSGGCTLPSTPRPFWRCGKTRVSYLFLF